MKKKKNQKEKEKYKIYKRTKEQRTEELGKHRVAYKKNFLTYVDIF